jgi:hypothetical protein
LSRGERSKDIVKDQAKDEEESRSSRAHKIRSYVSNTKESSGTEFLSHEV